MVFRTVHGYRRAFRIAGAGPAILLIHGLGDSSATWNDVIPHLAKTHTVIAPDLLGHGRSDKPRADYSVAAYANGMRDLLSVLDIDKVTVIGHSLGGAVAMQFAYQYPQFVERLVLVSTSGITSDVHPLLRVLSAPVVNNVLRVARLPGAHAVATAAGKAIGHDSPDVLRIVGRLPERTSYLAFLSALRAVVDWRGQSMTLLDRSYLNDRLPVQIVWGAKDSVFPVSHAHFAHAAMPGSRVDVFNDAGHYPFRDDPLEFLSVVERFIDATAPAEFDAELRRRLLTTGSNAHPVSTAPDVRLAVLDAIGGRERSAT